MAIATYYGLTIASNCGAAERDCGAAIGLGLLAGALIWMLGAGVIALLVTAIARLRRRA